MKGGGTQKSCFVMDLERLAALHENWNGNAELIISREVLDIAEIVSGLLESMHGTPISAMTPVPDGSVDLWWDRLPTMQCTISEKSFFVCFRGEPGEHGMKFQESHMTSQEKSRLVANVLSGFLID